MTSETNLFYENERAENKAAAEALDKATKAGTYVSYFNGEERYAPSPFLPGTKVQFVWDSTSLGWLKTCPRLYEYQMIEGWRPKGSGVHLVFGQHYHSALELYDKLRADPSDVEEKRYYNHDTALQAVVLQLMKWTWEPELGPCEDHPTGAAAQPWLSDHPAKNRFTLVRSVIWYLDQFKDDPASTLILANGKPAVELSFRMELDWGPGKGEDWECSECGQANADETEECTNCGASKPRYILSGHLDRVVEFGGQKYVMDRKTTGSSPTPHYFDGFAPDNQMSIYTLAARVQFSTPVAGVIIDAAQIAVGFTRFQRGFTYRTETQLEEWLADFRFWTAQAEGFAERGSWPMNDKACGMYGGCTFRKICSKSPEVRERFLESDFERRPWNPLQSR